MHCTHQLALVHLGLSCPREEGGHILGHLQTGEGVREGGGGDGVRAAPGTHDVDTSGKQHELRILSLQPVGRSNRVHESILCNYHHSADG